MRRFPVKECVRWAQCLFCLPCVRACAALESLALVLLAGWLAGRLVALQNLCAYVSYVL